MNYLDSFIKLKFLYLIYKPFYISCFFLTWIILDRRKKTLKAVLIISLILVSSISLNTILKFLIEEPLPTKLPYNFTQEAWNLVRNRTYSMPSTHTAFVSTLMFSVLLFAKDLYGRKVNLFLRLFLGSFLLISSFRIVYLGYHFLSDVVVAMIISLFYSYSIYSFTKENTSKKLIILAIYSILISTIAWFFFDKILEYYYGLAVSTFSIIYSKFSK